jgi:hypothetical protein
MLELENLLISLAMPDESSLFWVLSTWSLEVVYLEEVFQVTWVHSLIVAPKPLAISNKKLEGLEFCLLKKLKNSSEDMYLTAPEHLFKFFSIVKNLDRGSSIVFLGSRLYVQSWWRLAVELNPL